MENIWVVFVGFGFTMLVIALLFDALCLWLSRR